jgi:hypothetical protein
MEGVRGSIPLPPTIDINSLAFVSCNRAHVSPMKVATRRAMFAETPSMEAIVSRAQAVILDAICVRLSTMPLQTSPTLRR